MPNQIENEDALETLLSEPTEAVIEAMAKCPGDLMLLGVAGKMGPSLARMALRADQLAGTNRRIIGVSRFSNAAAQQQLEKSGIETLKGDLLDEDFLASLPETPNLISMTGAKFGTASDASASWGTNVHLSAAICKKFQHSRIAAFSTGNVYPLVAHESGGCRETDPMNPVGEYAITAMGRERTYEYFSRRWEIPTSLIRLNYAAELRYGVLVDIAQQVLQQTPIDLSMSFVNVIWQGDANAMSIACLADAAAPPFVINVAGSEILRVKEIAENFGQLLSRKPIFTGEENDQSLLNNGSLGHQKYGQPRVSAEQLMGWVASWIERGGSQLGKPTKFQVRDGAF